jgi:hypothetical protein
VRLLPAGRRDWFEAVWAEAYEVPPGLPRLAWRADGIWMLAREALMPRRLAKAALLAGLPLLARRLFGPASPSRAGRSLRVFCCAAILALIPARVIVEVFADLTPRQEDYLRIYNLFNGIGVRGVSSGGPPWPGEIAILLIIAGYVTVLLWLTSRRSQLNRSTLAIGTGMGLPLGLVMYAVAPLGLGQDVTNPWLPGADADPLIALAWLLLLGGPVAAGVLATLTGALLVTALGTGSTGTQMYALICVAFPVIGLIMGGAGPQRR